MSNSINSLMQEQNVIQNFLSNFQLIPHLHQKVWRYLQYYSNKFENVFPSQKKMAEDIGCCRDTVIQACKGFEKKGWMVKIRRCFRSNLYCLNNDLIVFDTTLSATFLKPTQKPTMEPTQKPTQVPTLYTPYKTDIHVMDVRKTKPFGIETVQQSSCKSEAAHLLTQIGISGVDLWCLTRYPLNVIAKAVEDYKTRKANEKIRNLPAWLTNRCKSYATC